MPQIIVEVSSGLDHVDWRGFARELHPVVVETAAARLEACKTRILRTEDDVVGAETEGHAIVNVTIALLAGRTDETRARLTEAALELLGKYVEPTDGLTVHASVETRELDPSYRKFER
jgi:5-carboxymethyl-2-hydroxymuconate isomerase